MLICAAGFTAFQSIPRAEDPELTSRDAIVITPYPGAGASRIEALVTDPIEDSLREFEEILTFDSESNGDISSLHIELKEHLVETDGVWSRIRDQLEDVEDTLPAGAGPIDFEAFEISAFTIILALVPEGEPSADLSTLTRRAEELADHLRAVTGTKEVEVYGSLTEQITVDLDPALLAQRGMSLAEVAMALRGRDAKVPAGVVHTPSSDLIVAVDSELDSVARVARTPIRVSKEGPSTYLADLGEIRKGERIPQASLALVEGERSVLIGVRMMSSQRVDTWSAKAREAIQEYESAMPRGMALRSLFDQSTYTRDRLGALVFNFGLGALLVMIVVFFTMGWRSAFMVGTTLPLAILLALKGMQSLEIPINQMSVAGLIIALGLLIDNAIVMVDELSHRLEAGSDFKGSGRSCRTQIGVALIGLHNHNGIGLHADRPDAWWRRGICGFDGHVRHIGHHQLAPDFVLAASYARGLGPSEGSTQRRLRLSQPRAHPRPNRAYLRALYRIPYSPSIYSHWDRRGLSLTRIFPSEQTTRTILSAR